MAERETVYMSPDDWQPSEFEAEIQCPYCHKTNSYCSGDAWFTSKVFTCDDCGKKFSVYCEF